MKISLGDRYIYWKKYVENCFLGITQNNFQYDIHPNEKSIIQHKVLFMLQNKWSMLENFASAQQRKRKAK